jgi:hypothetical protein
MYWWERGSQCSRALVLSDTPGLRRELIPPIARARSGGAATLVLGREPELGDDLDCTSLVPIARRDHRGRRR